MQRILIPPDPEALLARLETSGHGAWLVGGCVRDSLLGLPPKDWDICTTARPEQVMALFGGAARPTGLRHGTVTVAAGGRGYEITTCRRESGYSDYRHPDRVDFVQNLEEDLARRDFTINAMAYSPKSGVIDPFGGRQDLSGKILRCVGQPERRFREDALRLLRALRFAARFNLTLEPETQDALLSCRTLLDEIAPERIFTEWKGILTAPGVATVLRQYREVFAQTAPELRPMFDFDQRNPHHCWDVWEHTLRAVETAPPDPVLRLALLFHDAGKPACFTVDSNGMGHFYGHAAVSEKIAARVLSRLRGDRAARDRVCTLIRVHGHPLPETPKAMRRLIFRLGEDMTRDLLAVWRADGVACNPAEWPRREAALRRAEMLLTSPEILEPAVSRRKLSISGRELMALGMDPGPALGQMLDWLLEQVVEEMLPDDPEALLEAAQRRMEGISPE